MDTFKFIVAAKALSQSLATKLAGNGLCFQHVAHVFQDKGRDGVSALLMEKDKDGKARIKVKQSH